MSKYKLYSDSETFQREYPGAHRLREVMACEAISGRARIKIDHGDDAKTYRVDRSGFEFTIREVWQ